MYPGIDVKKYEFPFENLVFEGGGSKGIAYVGAIKVCCQIINCKLSWDARTHFEKINKFLYNFLID